QEELQLPARVVLNVRVEDEAVENIVTYARPSTEIRQVLEKAGVELVPDRLDVHIGLARADAAQRVLRAQHLEPLCRLVARSRQHRENALYGHPKRRLEVLRRRQGSREMRRHDADDAVVHPPVRIGLLAPGRAEEVAAVLDLYRRPDDVTLAAQCLSPVAVRNDDDRLRVGLVLGQLETSPEHETWPDTAEKLRCYELADDFRAVGTDPERQWHRSRRSFDRRGLLVDALYQRERQTAGVAAVVPAESDEMRAALEARMGAQDQIDVQRDERRDGRKADREHGDGDETRARGAPIAAKRMLEHLDPPALSFT